VIKIRQIIKREFEAEMADYLKLLRGWRYCQWEDKNFLKDLPGKWDLSFATFEADRLVGCCFASDKQGVYYIHLFYLALACRGQGHGKTMVQYAVDLAQLRGLGCIELRCPASNREGLQFYQRSGFESVSLCSDHISGDEPDHYLRRTC